MTKIKLLISILFLGNCFLLSSQNNDLYHKAKIYYQGTEDLIILNSLGIEIDHGKHKKGVFIESDFSSKELKLIEDAGFDFKIEIFDVVQFYQDRNNKNVGQSANKNLMCTGSEVNNYPTPDNFELGSMGGFMTYDVILAELDQMAMLYPELITTKAPIGDFETVEGRSLFWVRMSDNPEIDEDEPEMLYDAIHHAREPASVSTLIFYMWYLLENYENNAEVQAILNNSQLYFVPVVNPDGYVFNEILEPDGGALWRKNRRVHDDGEFGVDNNRNYGYEWGTNGISFDTESNVFCGDSAFSEVENQAMRWFCENHEFQIAFNNHSYGNLLLYPFGYEENVFTAEQETFETISDEMVAQNGFTNQTGSALYPASGVADDWMYEETPEKGRIFSFTPEIGTGGQGFWPVSSDIIPLCHSIMHMNLTAAHLITKYAQVTDQVDPVLNEMNGSLDFDLRRMGFQDSDFTVTVLPITPNMVIDADEVVFAGLGLFNTSSASMPYTLDPSIINGDIIQYQYLVDNGDYIDYSQVFTKTFGVETIVFEDDASSTTEWAGSDWGITTEDFVSAPSSFTDSPNAEYENETNSYFVLAQQIDLQDVVAANLQFSAKWAIETDWDYAQIEVSIDNFNWEPQCGNYTSIGNSDQAENEPLYHGFQNTWVEEFISLSDYVGEIISIRFQMHSDNFVTEDGFYFDDIVISTIDQSVGINEVSSILGIISQNIPNPVSDFTTIHYVIPPNVNDAHVIIQNYMGQEIERIKVGPQENNVKLDVSGYASGSDFYSIVSSLGASETKLMVILD